MAIEYRVGDRANNTTRTITNIVAGGAVTHSGGALGSVVGRVFEITGNGTAENNVNGYTCTAVSGNTVTLRPAPNTASTNGTLALKTAGVTKTLDASSVTSITALPGSTNLAILQVTGANFINPSGGAANALRPNDVVVITGDSTTANNGYWNVHGYPLTEDTVVLRPPDGGTGLSGTTSGASIAARHGIHALILTDEAPWGKITGSPSLTFQVGPSMSGGPTLTFTDQSPSNDTIDRSDGATTGWDDDGFAAGRVFTVVGGTNPGTYTIQALENNLGTNDRIRITTAGTFTNATETVTSLTGDDRIIRSDASNFASDGFATGEALIIQGSTSNDVIESTFTILRFATVSGTNDTIEVAFGSLVAEVASAGVYLETAGLTWLNIRDKMVPVAGPVGSSMGGGSGPDYIINRGLLGRDTIEIHGFSQVNIISSGLSSKTFLRSENQVVTCGRHSSPGNGGDSSQGPRLNLVRSSAPGFHIRLGSNYEQDDNSGDRGSTWTQFTVGIVASGTSIEMYGSLWDGVSDGPTFLDTITINGSVFRPNLEAQIGSTLRLRSTTLYGQEALLPLSLNVIMENILIASTSVVGPTAGLAVFESALFGANLAGWNPLGGAVVLDPLEDVALNTLFVASGSGATLQYTYNPRFLLAQSQSAALVPLSGLSVQILEIREDTGAQTVVHDGKLDANGRIANGVGVILRREHYTSVSVFYRHYLILQGGGIQRITAPFVMRAPVLGDINVARLNPNWEGEYALQ